MTSRNKIGIIAGLCLLLLAASIFTPASCALDTWDGTAATQFDSGSGSETDPFIIKTGSQLARLAQIVNGGGNEGDTTGFYYKLDDDVDLNGSVHLWTPMGDNVYSSGSDYKRFRGHFNGNGHVISNMRIIQSSNYAGLFGIIHNTALIENIALVNVDVSGRNYVGALVGDNFGGEIKNCVTTGQVTGNDGVGGLVGYNEEYGSVSNSMSSCFVTGQDDVGGLVGHNINSTVYNCIVDGRVTGNSDVGGLIGYFYDNLSNSIAAGKVQGLSRVGARVGGNHGTITSTVNNWQGTGFVTGTDLVDKGTWELTTGNAVAGLGGSWMYKSGYYPRPRYDTIARDGIRVAAAFAASPIYLNEGDSTADVNHSFKVPTKTADDTPITWTASPADMADINQATGDVTLKYIGTLSLTGKSGLHSKNYALTVHNVNPSTEYRTVTFNSDGGNYTPTSQSVGIGYTVEEPTPPTKDGYVFDGWYWNEKMWDFGSDTVTENMTLIARWRNPNQTTYTVTFNSVGGSSVLSQNVAHGGRAIRPTNPTRSGYTFSGWYSDSAYNNLWDFDTVMTGNITLYARWTPTESQTTHTVTFNSVGGNSMSSQTVAFGGKATRPANPTRSGYIFAGWYSDSTYNNLWDFDTVVTDNITLYAKWTPGGDDSKSKDSSSGCDSLGVGLLALAGLVLLKKRSER
ncbi:MAG: InlB B-repeat-containing protein [Synergistaceae bacterium]|nr:InlB B-repeat-containing protein [Synergistaceae bacterium]